MKHKSSLYNRAARPARLIAALMLIPLPAIAVSAAPDTSVVRGRVLDASTGKYILNARVSVAGTGLAVSTDDFGEYIITGAPAGEITLRASYGDLAPAEYKITTTAGGAAGQDFELTRPPDDKVIVMDAYQVQSRREVDGKMIALNEQRYSPNLKSVVAADEFGDVTEGNIGEFLKYLPGVLVDYNAADARNISVRGLPPSATPVLMDGNRVASASSSAATRTFEFEQVSINNASRVEVAKAPTPDMPADSLGGTVNLISKSAFERSKPQFSARAYTNVNSTVRTTGAVYIGPEGSKERLIKPGFDFTYINPLSKNLGFTVSGLYSNQYNPTYLSQTNWTPLSSSKPSGAPAAVSGENPYMGDYRIQMGATLAERKSLGLTMDWRFLPHDVLTLRYQYNNYDTNFYLSRYFFNAGVPSSWGADFTTGVSNGTADSAVNWRHKYGTTGLVNLSWRHNGPVWKADAGLSYSRSSNHYRDISEGYFAGASAGISNAAVSFEGVGPLRVAKITLKKNDVFMDPFDLANYRLFTSPTARNANGYMGSVNGNEGDSSDKLEGAYFNLRRDFGGRIPFTIKTGGDFRRQTRDITANIPVWKYLGADRAENTADDGAERFVNRTYSDSAKMPYGWGRAEWLDARKLYQEYEAHKDYFAEQPGGNYGSIANRVNGSKYIREEVMALYLRGDAKFFNNRLWLVGGFRYERTDDKGAGPLNDQNALYKRDAGGNIIYDASHKPVLITTDAAEQARLRYKERGNKAGRSYDGLYPSLNLSHIILDNLVLRASYARTIGRPEFDKIIPNTAVPVPADDNATVVPTITVNNTGLKPWQADNYDVSLEYYFQKSSMLSLGVFRKEFSDFFGSMTIANPSAEILTEYGLDPELYAGYDLKTFMNVGDAAVTGCEVNYTQQLAFLPHWARGISIFGNATWLKLQGSNAADFNSFVPRMINWGISINRPRFSVMLKWVSRGEQRRDMRASTAANGVPPGTFEWLAGSTKLDINAEVRLTKWLSMFGSARNVTNEQYVLKRYSKTSYVPDYARTYSTQGFGVQMVFGVKANF